LLIIYIYIYTQIHMNAQRYSTTMQLPPPPSYQTSMQTNVNQMNYYRPTEERMADFEQLVGRYESKNEIINKKIID